MIVYLHETESCVFNFFISLRLSPWVSYRQETAVCEGWPVSQDVRFPERAEII